MSLLFYYSQFARHTVRPFFFYINASTSSVFPHVFFHGTRLKTAAPQTIRKLKRFNCYMTDNMRPSVAF